MWGLLFTSKGTSSFLFKSKRKYIIEALKTKINCVTYGQWTRRVAYHTHRGTHSKHETLSYLARTRIKVCFSTLPSFGGRGPTGSASLQTALFTPWCSLLHLVTCFWWEIVSFSIATRTSGSWWSCSGCETSILPVGQSQKISQAGPWTSSLQYYLSRFLCSDKSSLHLWPERCAKVPHDHNKCHRPGQLNILTFICTKPYMLITVHWKVLTNPTQCGNTTAAWSSKHQAEFNCSQ